MSLRYAHIVAADFEFEFGGRDGNLPRPVCMVARELRTGQEWRVWRGEFDPTPPFPTDPVPCSSPTSQVPNLDASVRLAGRCRSAILDLYAEFRDRTNGLAVGRGLIDALGYFGLDTMDVIHKDEMRTLILGGGPWTAQERTDILDYCAGDVHALERLLPAMLPKIDLPRALLRGRYMAAVSAMDANGVPIDLITLDLLRVELDRYPRTTYCRCGR